MLAFLLALCIDEAEVAALPAHDVCVEQYNAAFVEAQAARLAYRNFPGWTTGQAKDVAERRESLWTIASKLTEEPEWIIVEQEYDEADEHLVNVKCRSREDLAAVRAPWLRKWREATGRTP